MAFDGLFLSALVSEFKDTILGGKISKIVQSEKDELQLTIKKERQQYLLHLSVNPSIPLVYLTDKNKTAPLTAPSFCMALRKHIGNGVIQNITQASTTLSEEGLERVLLLHISHRDELGDIGTKYLSVEIMGKYSNIILLKEDFTILDAIKRISSVQSSVREVLPGRKYFIPDQFEKENLLCFPLENLQSCLESRTKSRKGESKAETLSELLFHSFSGLSPMSARELSLDAGLASDQELDKLSSSDWKKLSEAICRLRLRIQEGNFSPAILYENEKAFDFSAIPVRQYSGNPAFHLEVFPSPSELLTFYYGGKEKEDRVRQKSTDLKKQCTTLLERVSKKLSLQEKQLKDTEKKERFRIFGELLTTYGYSLKGGEKELICENYYNGTEEHIPLDESLSPIENAKKYFEKYDKAKRTELNLSTQVKESRSTLKHLQSILNSLSTAENAEDLEDIRREMGEYGYMKPLSKKKKKERKEDKSSPRIFRSSDGYLLYVGKNNYQNEEVSFRIAEATDFWFHVKGSAGSHVIAKTEGKNLEELPDRLFEEAAELAAYFSSEKESAKVEVDYTERKNLKKVVGGAPGFVIYHQNYSILVSPKKVPEEL